MFYCAMNCELSRHEPFVGRMASKRISLAPRDFMQQTAARCPSRRRHMPMSLSPDAHLAAATYPCQLRSMPISLWRHAYVTLATCLCHFGEMPMSPPATCLCRQSDIGISPAPHQKRPVYRCSGRPFFVLFGHFRHEMRIFPASEASFGADGGWPEQSANGRGGRRAHVVGGGRRTEASAIIPSAWKSPLSRWTAIAPR
jgi:hypothetical protein